MTLLFGLKIIVEVAVVLLIGYGIWNEDKLVAFEDKLFERIKKGAGNYDKS